MAKTITGKIKRKSVVNYIDITPLSKPKESYVRLRKDLEGYIVGVSANVEIGNNIWGETSAILDNYQPQASVGPYYAEIGEPLFECLQGIVDKQQALDDLKTGVVGVYLWDLVEVADGTYVAYEEDTTVEAPNYDGDTTGHQIPFNVHHSRNKVEGEFVLATRTFTADI